MGRKVQTVETVTITDDLDDKVLPDGTEPIYFGWGGRRYELYTSETHASSLSKALEKYVAAAKDVTTQARAAQTGSRSKTSTAAKADKEQLAAIRGWAQANSAKIEKAGLKVPGDRGRIAAGVVDLYNANQ